ncbi:MAG TPA: (Fe-S)-binding protein [Candidatus Anoxymicrobiaceae bacterium]|jgi:ArsR family metal-binding transcriptional regulator
MLIDDYEIELETPACDLESPIYAAKVRLNADVSDVLPYVNATVDKAEFIPGIPVLVWREEGHRYALRSNEIAISTLEDRRHAEKVTRSIVDRINAIWEDRENMEPSYDSWEKPKVLDILRQLPGTNCRECGVPTCMAFAAKLAEGKQYLDDCPVINEEALADKLASLQELGL